MIIQVQRKQFYPICTIGDMFLDGRFFCYTLEDVDRKLENGGKKIDGQTAIPRGRYQILITYSNRFKRELPLLVDVPGFKGVRIHPGNTSEDTEGCILVGAGKSNQTIIRSRIAFNSLFELMDAAIERGSEIWCEIV